MKSITKTLAMAGIAAAAFAATPAAAQVSGIATSSPEAVIVRSQARINAYKAIDQANTTQIQQIRTLRQDMANLQQSLDTNKDGQLTETEVNAGKAVVTQIQQKEQQAAALTQPIILAQTYAIEQLLKDYGNSRQQVIQAKKIQLMLDPNAIQYAPDSVDVTTDIVNALNQRVPSVQTTPPAGWQPQQESYATQQAVQQILVNLAQQQAASAQQPAAATAPAQQQPSGR